MKILLIGKNGQVGAEIDKESKKLGHKILSFGREDLDITDLDASKKKIEEFKPEIVINTAAYHVVPECEKNPEQAFLVNTIAQRNLAKVCQEMNIKLAYYSTDRVFDGRKRKPYKETDKANPIQIYGLSKLAGEMVSLNYNSKSIVIRTCGIFGGLSGSRCKKGNFVLYILKQAKEKKELEISLDQIASFVYAKDLAQATLKLLEKDVSSGIYHVVNDGYGSWAEFAKQIVKIKKLSLKIIPVDRHGSYGEIPTPIFTAFDISKIKDFGIKMPTWQNGLKRYLDFLSN